MSWRDYVIVVGLCWITGTLVGAVMYFVLEMPMSWWPLLPFTLPMAAVIALPFAAIAGPIVCVALILVLKLGFRPASLGTWIAVGAVGGAAAGALHPLNLLSAVVDQLASGPGTKLPWTLLAMSATSGAPAGALVAWWYRGWAIPSEPTAFSPSTGQLLGEPSGVPQAADPYGVGRIGLILLFCGAALVPVGLIAGWWSPLPNGSSGAYLAGLRPAGLYNLHSDGDGGLLHVLVLQPTGSQAASSSDGFQLGFMSASEHIVWKQHEAERSLSFTYHGFTRTCEIDGHRWSAARYNVFVVRLDDQWRPLVEPAPVRSKATNSHEVMRDIQAALPNDPEIASLRIVE